MTGKKNKDNSSIDVKTWLADEAKRITSGARRAAYGKPERNFDRIASLWNAFLALLIERDGELDLKARDVSTLMILMKLARIVETPDHADSFVDIVGYALTGAECAGVTAQ